VSPVGGPRSLLRAVARRGVLCLGEQPVGCESNSAPGCGAAAGGWSHSPVRKLGDGLAGRAASLGLYLSVAHLPPLPEGRVPIGAFR